MEFYGIHYQAVVLENKEAHKYEWLSLESYNIFEISINYKLYPICNKLTYSASPSIEYNLCKLQVHYYEGSSCTKYQDDIETQYMKANFYYPVCLDTLILYKKSTGKVYSIKSLINCLRLFNIKDAEVREDEEIEILTNVIRNIIENYYFIQSKVL